MKSSYQVVLSETSIVVLFKGIFQTSIPLREWSTHDGSTWSGLLRQGHQIDWLVGNLNDALNAPTTESTMQRVHRVLADASLPPRLSARTSVRGGVALAPREVSITRCTVPMQAPLRRIRA
jgi:hypothetical protein